MNVDSNFDKQAYNEQLRDYIRTDQFDKVAAAIRPYIRTQIYEDSFADEILAVRQVSDAELQVDTETDSFYVVSSVEQDTAEATVANFRDRPYSRYAYGKRFEIPIGEHQTPILRKNRQELKAYDYDLLSDAADKDAHSLGVLRDFKVLEMLNECVRINDKNAADVTDNSKEGNVQVSKQHIRDLQSTLTTTGRTGLPAEKQLEVSRMLIHEGIRKDFAMLGEAELGDNLTSEVFTEGFTRESVLGTEFISSIKRRLLTEHERAVLVDFNGGNGSTDETVGVNGEDVTVNAGSADAAAQALVDAINGATPADGKPGIVEEVDGAPQRHITAEIHESGVARLNRTVDYSRDPAALDEKMFRSLELPVDTGNYSGGTDISKGMDRFDVLWAMPDPEFMGEIVRPSGEDIRSEVWKTDGENEINRRSWEQFGMGIGNVNSVAKKRLQRERFLG